MGASRAGDGDAWEWMCSLLRTRQLRLPGLRLALPSLPPPLYVGAVLRPRRRRSRVAVSCPEAPSARRVRSCYDLQPVIWLICELAPFITLATSEPRVALSIAVENTSVSMCANCGCSGRYNRA